MYKSNIILCKKISRGIDFDDVMLHTAVNVFINAPHFGLCMYYVNIVYVT